MRASRAILACSDFTRREIARRFPDLRGRVVHVPLAADDDLPPAAAARRGARARLGVRGPVLLTVGAILNRRCLPVLLRAVGAPAPAPGPTSSSRSWARTARTRASTSTALVADARAWSGASASPGFVDERGLAARYAAADVAVFLSEYEGFGLPALEAMARGVPVVASRRPALGEIFGEAALLVEPGDDAAGRGRDRRVLARARRCAPTSCARGPRPGRPLLLGGDGAPDARGARARRPGA